MQDSLQKKLHIFVENNHHMHAANEIWTFSVTYDIVHQLVFRSNLIYMRSRKKNDLFNK